MNKHTKAVVSFDKPNREAKLIKIPGGDKQRKQYGVNVSDTFNLDSYLAVVIANGLRLLAANSHCKQDLEGLEAAAMKLEFYASDPADVIHDNIDWSQDPDDDDDFLAWVNAEDQTAWPAMNEYRDKVQTAEEVQDRFAREALEWVATNFGTLWD
jgi:hypothetical protein